MTHELKRGSFASLCAAAALANATGCAPLAARLARWRHGCPEAPALPAPLRSVRIEAAEVATRSGTMRDVAFTTATERPRKIAIVLPGRSGTAAEAIGSFAPYLAASRFDVALVGVGGGESYWHPRASGEDRLGSLLETIVPWARRRWPSARGKLGILGMSMGAFGSIAAAERRPDLFDRLCAISPAIWQSRAEQASAVPDAFDGAEDFAAYDPFSHAGELRDIGVRIVCGTKDPFYPAAVAFASRLHRDGVRVATQWLAGGCHEEASWQRTRVTDLAFVAEKEKARSRTP